MNDYSLTTELTTVLKLWFQELLLSILDMVDVDADGSFKNKAAKDIGDRL